jgi:hypothetical protein
MKTSAKKSRKAPKVQNPEAITGGASSGDTIDAADRARAYEDYTVAVKAGFTFTQGLRYALGEPVNRMGVENLSRSRMDFEERPLLDVVVGAARDVIAAEERRDHEVSMADLRMMPDGRLFSETAAVNSDLGGLGVPLTSWTFEALCNRGAFPAFSSGYLSQCDEQLRAVNANHHLPKCVTPKGEPIALRVRTRKAGDKREAFSLTSQIYRTYDADRVLGLVSKLAQRGARAAFSYDGSRWELRIYLHTDIKPEKAVAGEIFKACVIVWGSDDGKHALHFGAAVERNLCKNVFIIEEATAAESWTTHIRKDLDQVVEQLLGKALGAIDGFAEKWNAAAEDRIMEGIYGSYEVRHVFEQLVRAGLVSIPGVKREEMVDRLVRAWEKEPGWTRSDLANAVTRAAHEEMWGSTASACTSAAAAPAGASSPPRS